MHVGFTSHQTKCAIVLALTLYISICAVSFIHGSELITHKLDSKEIAGNVVGISSIRQFQVYLPDTYGEEFGERYPVLYWIPWWGQGVTGYSYRKALDDAITSNRIPPTIAVFTDAHEKVWFLNSPALGDWEDFLILELIPFIDNNYRTISGRFGRALMGLSSGGYTALILPIRHPDIWAGIGMNDPALWAMWSYIHDKEDFPISDVSYAQARAFFRQLPENINGYNSANEYVRDIIQFGTAFSPNPDNPLLCDMPVTPQGEWDQAVRQKWSDYDLTNPQTLARHKDTLDQLLSIVIVVPEVQDINRTNSVSNMHFLEQAEAAGVDITRLDMSGGHLDNKAERFVAMAEQILATVIGAETSVSSIGKSTVTWAKIKQEH